MEEQCIMHRIITCACEQCLRSNYSSCLTNSTWTTKLLRKDATEELNSANGSHAIDTRFIQEAVLTEERSASQYAIGNMAERWQRQSEINLVRSNARQQRIADRDATKENNDIVVKRPRKNSRLYN